ncbi:MAG: flavodoxin family protein [Acidobacteriota bacterium]
MRPRHARIRSSALLTAILVCAIVVCTIPASAQTQAPVRILITYHSQTGNTENLAQAVAAGAKDVPGVVVTLAKMADVKDADIATFDGVVVGTPVHWASLSTESRRFLDRLGAGLGVTKVWGDGRTAGVFCTGGNVSSGKEMARLAMMSSLMEMRFIVIGGVDADGFGTLGPSATTGPADPGVSEIELKEGRAFGERFARFTRQFRAGETRK